MNIEKYRQLLREKMDHARIAERRRKLWLTVVAALALLGLMIGSVIYVACTWDSGVPPLPISNDYYLEGYDSKGESTNVMTSRANFYSANTLNIDTLLDKGNKSEENFMAFVNNHAAIFEEIIVVLKQMSLLDDAEFTESRDNATADSTTVPTSTETVQTEEKYLLHGFDAEGGETKVYVTMEQLQAVNTKNIEQWRMKDNVMDSTYVKFVKHFYDRLVAIKGGATTPPTEPTANPSKPTAQTVVADKTVGKVPAATPVNKEGTPESLSGVPPVTGSTVEDLSKQAEKAVKPVDGIVKENTVVLPGGQPTSGTDQPSSTPLPTNLDSSVPTAAPRAKIHDVQDAKHLEDKSKELEVPKETESTVSPPVDLLVPSPPADSPDKVSEPVEPAVVPESPLVPEPSKVDAVDPLASKTESSAEASEPSADKPEEKPLDALEEKPLDAPEEKPLDAPEEKPLDALEKKPLDTSGEKPLDAPEEKPLDAPEEKPLDALEKKPLDTSGEKVPAEPALRGAVAPSDVI